MDSANGVVSTNPRSKRMASRSGVNVPEMPAKCKLNATCGQKGAYHGAQHISVASVGVHEPSA